MNVKRAGLENTCYVIVTPKSEFGRWYFIGIKDNKAVFTSDILWARAYKTAKRAKGRIQEIAKIMGIDEEGLEVIRYVQTTG